MEEKTQAGSVLLLIVRYPPITSHLRKKKKVFSVIKIFMSLHH